MTDQFGRQAEKKNSRLCNARIPENIKAIAEDSVAKSRARV